MPGARHGVTSGQDITSRRKELRYPADPAGGGLKAELEKMDSSKQINIGGVDTHYYEAGRGEPILFVYGGNFGTSESASSAPVWKLNFDPLSQRHRVIALDKLGQGRTGQPLRDEDYTMAAVVRHIADFIRALGLPPVHIVGHSRGGFASTRLTLDHPELVKSLTLVSSGTLSPRPSTNEPTLTNCPFPAYSRESARWVYEGYSHLKEAVTEEWIDGVMSVFDNPVYREGVRKFVEEQCGRKYFYPQLAEMKRDTLQLLADGALQRPLQIIFAQNDPTVAVEGAFDLFETVSTHQRDVELHIINMAGHFSFREHPERFNGLLDRFVRMNSELRV